MLGEKLPVDVGDRLGVGAVIDANELDISPEEAALCVDVFLPYLMRQACGWPLAARGPLRDRLYPILMLVIDMMPLFSWERSGPSGPSA